MHSMTQNEAHNTLKITFFIARSGIVIIRRLFDGSVMLLSVTATRVGGARFRVILALARKLREHSVSFFCMSAQSLWRRSIENIDVSGSYDGRLLAGNARGDIHGGTKYQSGRRCRH